MIIKKVADSRLRYNPQQLLRYHMLLLWCPLLLLWCPLLSSIQNYNCLIGHRGAPYQREIAVPLWEKILRPEAVFIFCWFIGFINYRLVILFLMLINDYTVPLCESRYCYHNCTIQWRFLTGPLKYLMWQALTWNWLHLILMSDVCCIVCLDCWSTYFTIKVGWYIVFFGQCNTQL